jgi:sigma-B regulation protein RsbU (phosphoserine phosphatase)
MSTASLFPDFIPKPKPRRQRVDRVRSLRLLNQAAQKINSILDLDLLLEQVVSDVVVKFGFVESGILLKDEERDELVLTAIHGCTTGMKGARYKIGEEGLVGHVARTGETYYAPDVRDEPMYVACEPETMSEVDIPLHLNGNLLGVLSVQHPQLNGFGPEQIELLEGLAGHIAVAVENARRFQRERSDKEHLHTKEQEARYIQQALFPKTAPFIAGLEVQGCCVPADAVGGDWYDYIPLKGGRWGLVLGDVSGKGIAAALTMSATRALVRSFADASESPAAVLARVNQVLLDDLPGNKFVTAVYAVLDPAARKLTFANAGHPWPLFANGNAHFLQTQSGLPLGIAPGLYDEHEIQLAPGASVLFYSDGITEAANSSGEEYGIERLLAGSSGDLSPESIIDEVCNFSGSRVLSDDATVILVRSRKD